MAVTKWPRLLSTRFKIIPPRLTYSAAFWHRVRMEADARECRHGTSGTGLTATAHASLARSGGSHSFMFAREEEAIASSKGTTCKPRTAKDHAVLPMFLETHS